MERTEMTETEIILQKTIEDLGQRIASLTVDLSLARAQILTMKEREEKDADK